MNFTLMTCDIIYNSLAPEGCGSNFTSTFFKVTLQIDILNFSCDNVPRWMPQNLIHDKSTLA